MPSEPRSNSPLQPAVCCTTTCPSASGSCRPATSVCISGWARRPKSRPSKFAGPAEYSRQAGRPVLQSSEDELHRKLHYAVALLLRYVTKGRCVQLTGGAAVPQSQVGGAAEGPKRMVKEVVPVSPELQLH